MKTVNKSKGNLVGFLIANYILFTLLVIFALLSILITYFFTANNNILKWNDDTPESYKQILQQQDYQDFPTKRVFGEKGAFLILDEKAKPIYASEDAETIRYTPDQIEIIPYFDKSIEVSVNEYTDQQGKEILVVSKMQSALIGEERKSLAVFDKNYNILYSSHDIGKESLSLQEYNLYTMTPTKDTIITKYPFTTDQGNDYIMLILSDSLELMLFKKVNRMFFYAIGLFGIIYIGLILLFVFWLNQKIKKPLRLLDMAITNFSYNKRDIVIRYSGPKEFVKIFDSFEKMSQRLQISESETKALQDEKKSMLADISHDLKTPITVIQGYAKALNDGLIPEEEKSKYLSTIYQKSQTLTELINAFSEYNKLEHPDYNANPTCKDICEFSRQYLADKYNDIEAAGFLLNITIPDKKIYCNIDEFHFKRVFDNILFNSLKYNPKGTNLFFQIIPEQEQVKIILADTGVGIPTEVSQSIFQPFIVGNSSRNATGSGLGLAIVKKLVLMHQGDILLKLPPFSQYSTEFQIILPICNRKDCENT